MTSRGRVKERDEQEAASEGQIVGYYVYLTSGEVGICARPGNPSRVH
jgi:hypothetical protein